MIHSLFIDKKERNFYHKNLIHSYFSWMCEYAQATRWRHTPVRLEDRIIHSTHILCSCRAAKITRCLSLCRCDIFNIS